MLRVWAATQPHLRAFTVDPGDVAIVRRLSSAYPEIPGGQWLGFSSDLVPRQLNWAQAPSVDEAGLTPGATAPAATGGDAPTRGGVRRVRDLIDGVSMVPQPDDGQGEDPAHTVLVPPFTRASRLGLLARGETGRAGRAVGVDPGPPTGGCPGRTDHRSRADSDPASANRRAVRGC